MRHPNCGGERRKLAPDRDSPILVVLELTGGNDGLNTVVPYRDDVYRKSRPTLRVEPGKVLKLDDHAGLHPALKDLKALWDQGSSRSCRASVTPGRTALISGRWRSADRCRRPVPLAGWLGRVGDETHVELCHVGDGSVPQALVGRRVVAQSLASIADYRLVFGAQVPSQFPAGPVAPALQEIRRRYTSAAGLLSRLESVHLDAAEPAASDWCSRRDWRPSAH